MCSGVCDFFYFPLYFARNSISMDETSLVESATFYIQHQETPKKCDQYGGVVLYVDFGGAIH